jgi:hypothetical protein
MRSGSRIRIQASPLLVGCRWEEYNAES